MHSIKKKKKCEKFVENLTHTQTVKKTTKFSHKSAKTVKKTTKFSYQYNSSSYV